MRLAATGDRPQTRSPAPSTTRSPTTSSSASTIGTAAVAHHGHTAGQQLPQLLSRPAPPCVPVRTRTLRSRPPRPRWPQPTGAARPTRRGHAATHSITAKKCTNCAPSRFHNGTPGGVGRRFGPSRASRARASDQLRPARLTSGPARSVTRRWSRPERESGKGEGPFFERAPARDLRLCATSGEVGHSRAGARPGTHCLLNQNTRYLGRGRVPEPGTRRGAAVPRRRDRIVQMACPEQRTWGRVLKRRFLWVLDHPRPGVRWHPWSRPLAPTAASPPRGRPRHRPLHQQRVRRGRRGRRRRITVMRGGAPPSISPPRCRRWGQALPDGNRLPAQPQLIAAATCPGTGLFIHALTGALTRRGLTVPMSEVTITPAEAPPALSRLAEELPPVPSSPDIGGAAVLRRGRFSSHTPIKGERAAGRLAAFESQNRRLSASDAPAGKDRRRAPRGRRPSSP